MANPWEAERTVAFPIKETNIQESKQNNKNMYFIQFGFLPPMFLDFLVSPPIPYCPDLNQGLFSKGFINFSLCVVYPFFCSNLEIFFQNCLFCHISFRCARH